MTLPKKSTNAQKLQAAEILRLSSDQERMLSLADKERITKYLDQVQSKKPKPAKGKASRSAAKKRPAIAGKTEKKRRSR